MEHLLGATVLLVEDESDMLKMLRFEFQSLGCRTLLAENGLEAFEIAQSQQVDAVVSDIRMPNGSGLDLLHRLKAVDLHKPVVIFISGYADIAPMEVYNLGAEALVPKPFRLRALVTRVARLLSPLESRWSAAPAKRVEPIVEQQFTELAGAKEEKSLVLGRGGMFLRFPGARPKPHLPIAFRVDFASGPLRRIEGTGTVRWAKYDAQTRHINCGIEFDYLTDATRGPVLEWLAGRNILPFIPHL